MTLNVMARMLCLFWRFAYGATLFLAVKADVDTTLSPIQEDRGENGLRQLAVATAVFGYTGAVQTW